MYLFFFDILNFFLLKKKKRAQNRMILTDITQNATTHKTRDMCLISLDRTWQSNPH